MDRRNQELRVRVMAVNVLMKKAETLVRVNPEQTEAYVAVIHGHKSRIIDLLSEELR